jgi:hypothetical protein
MFFGGGGAGGGGSSFGVSGGAGGDGGGIVFVFAQAAVIAGSVTADGAGGGQVFQNNRGGNGGSGAGGTVRLSTSLLTLSGSLSALGASRVYTSTNVSGGGGGGAGRIRVDAATVNGISSTAAGFTAEIDTYSALAVGSTNGAPSIYPTTSDLCATAVASPTTAYVWFGFATVESGVGGITYTLSSGGLAQYWDGAGWSTSSGPTDSNSAAVVDAQISSFPGSSVSWCAHLAGTVGNAILDDVTITWNDPPTADAGGPYSGDEGSAISVSAANSTDPEGALVGWAWDCDSNGSYETIAATATAGTCTFSDEGTYSIGLQVTDAVGLTSTATATVNVANVAPSFQSTPPAFATEGTLYSYLPTVTDPGADTFTFALAGSAPTAMTVAPNGLVEWTPTFADTGVAAVLLTVDDGDGGTDAQSWTVTVGFVDADNDGMADTWETANGLDPTDAGDATGDPDADGVSNLDEFLGGTDPNVFDGPGLPTLISPIGGEEVADARPDLLWADAVDPQNEPLTYDIEVYADAGMTALLTSFAGLTTTSVTVDLPLPENADAHWRARAADAAVAGNWTALEAFFVNEFNEAPDAPTLLYPVDGEPVSTLQPELQWSEAGDVDRDLVDYRVRVWDADFTTMLHEAVVEPNAWTVDTELIEDRTYGWEAQAIDEHGLEGPFSDRELFRVSSENAAPTAIVFLEPLDGDQIESTSPDLVVTESVDPEGSAVVYRIELDLASSFEGPDLITGLATPSGGEATWSLADADIELTEEYWYARARAEDGDGVGSPWDIIRFLVRGTNDAPPVPELIAPDDGAQVAVPTFVIGHVHDAEGDRVTYEVQVSVDLEGVEIVATVADLAPASGPEGTDDQTSWTPTVTLSVAGWWTARAVDERGAASDWAEPRRLTVGSDEPTGDETISPDCGCTTMVGASPSAVWLLPLLFARRRRR